jgi:hypothetical protein
MYREMKMGFWCDQGEAEMANFGRLESHRWPAVNALGRTQ